MFRRALSMIFCALLFAIFSVRADEWNKKTVVTFTQPVELPGIVLQPGTYVFRLLDSTSNRHIVQVFDKDEMKLFTTILALPNYRLEPTGDTVLRYEERPRTRTEALRAWFYPGDKFGQEFVYPKSRAVHLAEEVKAPVLAAEVTPETKPEELVKAPVETIEPQKEVAEAPPEHWAVPETTPVEPEPAPLPAPAPLAPELPATASPLPLVALFGMMSLTFALLLKRMS